MHDIVSRSKTNSEVSVVNFLLLKPIPRPDKSTGAFAETFLAPAPAIREASTSGTGKSSNHEPVCKVRAPFGTVHILAFIPLLRLSCMRRLTREHPCHASNGTAGSLHIFKEVKNYHLDFNNPEDGKRYKIETTLAQRVGRCFLDGNGRGSRPPYHCCATDCMFHDLTGIVKKA